ncbi:Hsp20 family protein [Nitrospirillum viridazoti]|uniref:Hsp20/alpha crystallin family protein n=1 Tax=Nitrospirillum amazonense TaxID=28077 RepID=A0A560IHN9_9PROT|nr:Hsp20 family protein [Nitrospirillum amazonense]TWB58516.1 Hsp20/alpha crystallin family protein [Nitrospirillum amazonense]
MRFSLAVAGFRENDLTITQEQDMLMVAGRKSDEGEENGGLLPVWMTPR